MSEPSSSPRSPGTATGEAVDAVQQALAAEHAALWSYGLATAFVADDDAPTVRTNRTAHRAQRDTCERILRRASATPVAPRAGYRTPRPVDGAESAMTLLVTAEQDCCSAWHGVLERTDDAALRRTALDALTYCAVRATHWRQLTGTVPSAAALPGTR